jgi:NDP-sugar pyrophosphorylase family protein
MAQRAMPSKAMLLAAGKGTRLKPLTQDISKCMVQIGGRPILEHNIEWLKKFGVTDLIVNLHHLPDGVTEYFGDGKTRGVRLAYSVEQELLGTAGAVKNVSEFWDGPFFVWYGDNLSTCRLDRLWELHQAKGAIATIALYHRDDPTKSGIVAIDHDDRVTQFLEKPRVDQIFSHWVSAGILVLEQSVLEAIPSGVATDFGRDIFPALLKSEEPIYGYRMSADEGLWWIDTAADLEMVQAAMPASLVTQGRS